jgi:MFS family permease
MNQLNPDIEFSGRHRIRLLLLSLAMVGAMTSWFAMTAVLPELSQQWEFSDTGRSMVTIMVQAGFVVGSLLSAFTNLPDRIQPERLFFYSAVTAGLTTLLTIFLADGLTVALILRFITGMALAGVYGPGLKLVSTWFRVRRGTAMGITVGALTVGSASPHLFSGFWTGAWEPVLAAAGFSSIAGGFLVLLFVPSGPYVLPKGKFDPKAIPRALSFKPVRLANYGYLGHMWELYAMWAWYGIFLTHSLTASGVEEPSRLASILTFVVISSGFFGTWLGGKFADKFGRELLTLWALGISAVSAGTIGFFYGASPWIVTAVGVIWGISIIADSAQFSALITEHADQRYVGSALTFQLAAGFALTIAAIVLLPFVENLIGWRYAFLFLVPGPIFAFISMLRMYRLTK